MIIKEGFQVNLTSARAVAMNDHLIMMYDKHIVKTEVTNSFNEYYVFNVDFIAINIQ
jgi:hypothetical protein